MKIGLICPYNINKHGGVLEVILALQKGLSAKGHEVKIITPRPRGIKDSDHKDVIFIGVSTDFRSPSHTTTQVSSNGDEDLINEVLEREKFDILHFHEPWVPLLSRQILQLSNAINVATFHANVPETIMTRTVIKAVSPYMKSVMKYLDVLTAVSPAAAEYAAGLTKKPISIVPNGIDLEKYKHPEKVQNNDGVKIISYVGRLERRKGVKYLIKAYSLFQEKRPESKLIIAGDGPDKDKLKLLADDLGVKNIEFLGYISESDKLDLLENSDIFCSPAVYGESFGIVLLEAIATGTVCVAGNNSGYMDVLKETGALSIVDPHNSDEFSRRLELLMYDENLRKLWKQWASLYIKQFDYPNIIDSYEKIYKNALEKYGAKK
jgi:phosphatidylinositol alpha-mannosyltransferase